MASNLLMLKLIFLQVLFPFSILFSNPAEIKVDNNQAKITFPEKIVFSASIQSDSQIKDITLEYGVDQLTCGKLISKAYPKFESGKQVDVDWTWEMKQSGSITSGSKIWWRWVVSDSNGTTQNTETQNITWIDNSYSWKKLSGTNINLYWYEGDNAYASDLLDNAVNSLTQLDNKFGLKPDKPIDIYIFASSDDLAKTMYYQPDWVGGLAFPENRIVLIGIPANQMEWGRHAETHELTHILVGLYSFSCLSSMPTWLNEGIAMYSEGDWDTQSAGQLKAAIQSDQIFSVRILSSSFPEDTDKANLAYSQSQSLVGFLIEKYDKEKILVTSGIGAREYYKKQGYKRDGVYMGKKI